MVELLRNINLSSRPCPKCIEAARQEPMTLKKWRSSTWGVPTSSGRYCEADCHCVLMPVGMIEKYPSIMGEKIRLRGDEGSDILKVVDIHPSELILKELMDEWNATRGKLPPEIYDMPVMDVIPYLKELMGKT